MPDITQREFDVACFATGVIAAGAANVTKVTLTARNANGRAVPYAVFDVFLSDAAGGAGLTTTTASGAVANDGVSGADFAVLTTKKALRVQANGAGVYALSITDTGKTAFKVCTIMGGLPSVVVTLATASYG